MTPQALVESGKVATINVGYQLLFGVASRESREMVDFPDKTTAEAHFKVDYFSADGERSVETNCRFQFRVTNEHVVTWIEDDPV